MAWSVDQASIGATGAAATATTLAHTTTTTVASGAWIFLTTGCWASASPPLVSSVAGGSLTWEVVDTLITTSNGAVSVALVRAYAPSGLASGTVITTTYAATATFRTLGGSSFLGGGSDSALEGSTAHGGAATAAWSVSPSSNSVGALVVAACMIGDPDTTTVDANSTEDLDSGSIGTAVAIALYHRISTATGTNTVGGTWSTGDTWSAIGGSFSLGGAVPVMPPAFNAIPFM